MNIWHLTPDAPRSPHRVSPGEPVRLTIGSWPVEPGQTVWLTYRVEHADGSHETGQTAVSWQRNEGGNSYWQAGIGPFARGDRVSYTVNGRSPHETVTGQRPNSG